MGGVMGDKNRTIYVERYGPQYSEWTPTHGDPWSVVVSFANEDVDTGEFQWLDSALEFAVEWVECGEGPVLLDGNALRLNVYGDAGGGTFR